MSTAAAVTSSSAAPARQSYLARQAIYDRDLNAVAYELLYRNGSENQAAVVDGDQATGEVMFNALVEMGLEQVIGKEQAFVNVTPSILLDGHCEAFPRDRIVIEVLEDIEPNDEIVAVLKQLSNDGFTIALDDFVLHDHLKELVRIADIIKIDVLALGREKTAEQVQRLQQFDVRLLAEKVETYEDFEFCKGLGMEMFQGYFVCKPQILEHRTITPDRLGTMQLLARLQDAKLEILELERLLMRDPAICVKLLRFINSSFCGLRNKVDSIRHAATLVGLRKIRIWAGLLAFGTFNDKPRELIRAANIRARMCERLAEYMLDKHTDRCFTVGLLSLLDAFSDTPLETMLARLPLSPEVTSAILHREGPAGRILNCVTAYERGDWRSVNKLQLPSDIVRNAYVESISWTQMVIDQMHV
ncbi:MAG: EAL and HDOD domain-containing protein [Planctomycetaceae bacterium]